MYSLKAILQKQPVAIAGALRSILFVAVLAGLVIMDEKLLSAIALTAEIVLNLFVWNAVTPSTTSDERVAQAYSQGIAQGKTGGG